MNVLLIDPGERYCEGGTEPHGKQTPHIGLVYLGSYLKSKGVEVYCLDLCVQDIDPIKFIEQHNIGLVGITAMSFNVNTAYTLFERIKKYKSNIITVLGGVHATTIPHKTILECEFIDYIIAGEGEESLYELVMNGGNDNHIIYGTLTDLDELPFPDWSLFDYTEYAKAESVTFQEKLHIYPISTMRGCAYNCIFCNGAYLGKKPRMRSARSIVAEIKSNMERFGARFFYMADSNFTFSFSRLREFCTLMIKDKLNDKVTWTIQSRIDLVNENICKLLKSAGCEYLFFGIESGDDDTLKIIDKGITTEKIKQSVKAAKQAGLKVRASFVIGLPFETEARIRHSIAFARSLPLDGYAFHILDIYPGTRAYKFAEEGYGGLRYANPDHRHNWDILNRNEAMVEVGDLTKGDIERLYKDATLRGAYTKSRYLKLISGYDGDTIASVSNVIDKYLKQVRDSGKDHIHIQHSPHSMTFFQDGSFNIEDMIY